MFPSYSAIFGFFFRDFIFWYRNLKVDFLMTSSSLKVFVGMKADETISNAMSKGVDPDPVLPPLLDLLAPGQVRNMYLLVHEKHSFNSWNPLSRSLYFTNKIWIIEHWINWLAPYFMFTSSSNAHSCCLFWPE